mmetsp:Transcript_35343/g.79321  ORF Transcript_35343/g.79321 Transcript_35343/m.79321 type:complete len:246 (-) Transcript_35343:260-997(-)
MIGPNLMPSTRTTCTSKNIVTSRSPSPSCRLSTSRRPRALYFARTVSSTLVIRMTSTRSERRTRTRFSMVVISALRADRDRPASGTFTRSNLSGTTSMSSSSTTMVGYLVGLDAASSSVSGTHQSDPGKFRSQHLALVSWISQTPAGTFGPVVQLSAVSVEGHQGQDRPFSHSAQGLPPQFDVGTEHSPAASRQNGLMQSHWQVSRLKRPFRHSMASVSHRAAASAVRSADVTRTMSLIVLCLFF